MFPAIKEMQVKIMRYHFIPIRVIMKKMDSDNFWRGGGGGGMCRN